MTAANRYNKTDIQTNKQIYKYTNSTCDLQHLTRAFNTIVKLHITKYIRTQNAPLSGSYVDGNSTDTSIGAHRLPISKTRFPTTSELTAQPRPDTVQRWPLRVNSY